MNPLYHTGDVVIVHKHGNYKVHDIVAYKVPKPNPQAGLEVIHRLIGGNGTTGWTVKGDNRTAADLWHPKNSDVVGSAWLHIPAAGNVVRYLHTPIGIAAVLALIAMGVVFKKGPSGKKEGDAPAVAAAPPPPAPEPEPALVAATTASPIPDSAEIARLTAVVQALQIEQAALRGQLDATRSELMAALASSASGGVDPTRQRELERALTEALLSAAKAGAELRLEAHREAEAILADAKERADRLERLSSGERQRATADLESIRTTLESSLEEIADDEPPAAPGASIVELFETERRRALGDA